MNARAHVTASSPERKRKDAVSKSPKADFSHPINSPIGRILYLQRTIGNRAVQKLLSSGVFQTKHNINLPGDSYGKKDKGILQPKDDINQRSPHIFSGRFVAHELTRVVQQRGFITQTIRLSPRRETESPTGWCVPYSSMKEAKKEWIHIFINVVGTLKAWLGDEVAALWADYLKRKPGDSLSPWIYSDPSSRLVRGFAESSTTEEHQRWLLDLAKVKLLALYKKNPNLIQPNKWNFIPVEKLFTESILNYEINWSRSPFDIPAMTAGGVSESDAGKDSRRLSGTVGVCQKTDEKGKTVGLTLMTLFRFHVKDCVDFCPGGSGAPAEEKYTVPMSRLEKSGLAYDRPFEVYFAPEPLFEELDV